MSDNNTTENAATPEPEEPQKDPAQEAQEFNEPVKERVSYLTREKGADVEMLNRVAHWSKKIFETDGYLEFYFGFATNIDAMTGEVEEFKRRMHILRFWNNQKMDVQGTFQPAMFEQFLQTFLEVHYLAGDVAALKQLILLVTNGQVNARFKDQTRHPKEPQPIDWVAVRFAQMAIGKGSKSVRQPHMTVVVDARQDFMGKDEPTTQIYNAIWCLNVPQT